jgi:hypothetical protein
MRCSEKMRIAMRYGLQNRSREKTSVRYWGFPKPLFNLTQYQIMGGSISAL